MEHVGMEIVDNDYAAPAAPVVKYGGDYVDGYSEGGASIIAYGAAAFSGFLVGLLVTWIF